MEKNIQKKYQAENPTVEIASEMVESLLQGERWHTVEPTAKGAEKPTVDVVSELCEQPVICLQSIDVERLTRLTSEDIIDRFLRAESHRIVAEEGEVESDIVTEAEIDDEEDFVSEELAEVYLQQGLKAEAKEIYRKLSLLNPEKSVYFAEIIAKVDGDN